MPLFIQKNLLLCVLVLLSLDNVLGEHVIITNKLLGHSDLVVHCKSRDDDLGVHVLRYGESTDWKFGLKIFGGTLFYCSFQWNGGNLHWIDIYKQRRDIHTCRTCNWFIVETAACRYERNGPVCYDFNN
ncbi:S-protein homolog 29-like [Cicer arietinum]|uniref:S-protein homolog n=1 Tax=Cicer arietinum TaxID=3827 RepID=A0A1S3DW21_CICAR|nr:S-protein homolog 29-like [Cicer arietinum]